MTRATASSSVATAVSVTVSGLPKPGPHAATGEEAVRPVTVGAVVSGVGDGEGGVDGDGGVEGDGAVALGDDGGGALGEGRAGPGPGSGSGSGSGSASASGPGGATTSGTGQPPISRASTGSWPSSITSPCTPTQTVSLRSSGLRTASHAPSSLRATASTRSPGAKPVTRAPPGQSRPAVVCDTE